MGHAGTIIFGSYGTATDKIAALKKAGVKITETLSDIDKEVKQALSK